MRRSRHKRFDRLIVPPHRQCPERQPVGFSHPAYDALPSEGAFVAIENLIDDERRSNAFGLMTSLNMLIEFGDAFDFTGRDFDGWCRKIGFRRTEMIPLRGPRARP
jgi:hypothetical protein